MKGVVYLAGRVQKLGIGRKIASRLKIFAEFEADSGRHSGRDLKKILNLAVSGTRFYSSIRSTALSDFPVVNKETIKSRLADFIVGGRVAKRWRLVSTSGSTGQPFKIYQSVNKVKSQRADVIAANMACGWRPGSPILYMRVWKEWNALSKLQRMVGRIYPIDGCDLGAERTQQIAREMALMNEPFIVLGYGSSLDAFASNILKLGMTAIPTGIASCIAMAEPVSEQTRQIFRSVFNVSVYARYSNAENGIIAHQVPGISGYVINSRSFKVEVLRLDSDQPAAVGELGRIVVTDLFNFALPLIRYDTGDLGRKEVVAGKAGGQIAVLTQIEGRSLDCISTSDGAVISPHSIDYAIRNVAGFERFQFEQVGRASYRIIIIPTPEFNPERVEDELKSVLGMDSTVCVEKVDSIPPEKSGKRPLVINRVSREAAASQF